MDKPIAWYDPTNGAVSTDKDSPLFTPLGQVLPLYTQRTWVGLTDSEISEAIFLMGFPLEFKTENTIVKNTVRNLEAKLKEKNEQVKNT